MVKRDFATKIFNAGNTPLMVKRLKKQISILDLTFRAKNLIFTRNALNTPPYFNIPQISCRGVFTANTTVYINRKKHFAEAILMNV